MRFYILSVDEFEITKIELYNILKNISVSIVNVKNDMEAISLLEDKKYSFNAVIWTMNSIEERNFESIKRLKSREACKNIPIIIISKFTDKKHIIKAIESGAMEYIAKPYDEEIVVKKIYRILGIPYEKAMDFNIDEDITTFNFAEMLSREVKGSSRGGYPISILMASPIIKESVRDLKDEKAEFVNLMIRVLKNKIRETDAVFHYGSDNLVVLLPFTGKDGIESIEKKIKEIYATNTLVKKRNIDFELVSASVTLPDDGKIKEKLLEILEERFEEKIKSINT